MGSGNMHGNGVGSDAFPSSILSSSTMVLFWKVYADDYAELPEYYPGQEVNAGITIRTFYYSGFEVPALAIFAFYVFIVALIAINASKKTLKFVAPNFYARQRARLGWLRAHVLNASLIGRKHSEPLHLFGRRWLPVRIPLRFQSFVIFALVLFNLTLLVTNFDITADEVNVYWPGPGSHHTQAVRYLADRSCVLAVGQLPLVFLTAGRFSPLALVTGLDFSDSMLYHRWLARMVWLQVSIHSFAYTYLEASSGYLAESFKQAYWNWGVAATAMFWGLTILAYGQLRTRAYEVFVTLHVVMGIMALVGVYFHIHLLDYWRYKVFIVLTEISASLWAFDRVARALNRLYNSFRLRKNGCMATGTITKHGEDLLRFRIELPLSRIQVPGQNDESGSTIVSRIAPGHSLRILVPRIQFFSDHPFTVLSTGKLSDGGDQGEHSDMGYVDLLIRQQQGFTKQMSKLENVVESIDLESGAVVPKRSAVIVEGPYGELHYEEVRIASHVLLFAGGVGVAYTLPYMIETALSNRNVPCTMTWMIRDIALFDAVMEQLTAAVEELSARSKEGVEDLKRAPLLINLHITSSDSAATHEAFRANISELVKHAGRDSGGASASGSGEEEKNDIAKVDNKALPTPSTSEPAYYDHLEPYFRVMTSYGRASVSSIVSSAAAATGEGAGKLVVMSCGPASLCDDVRYEAQKALSSGAWGDVAYFEECFNW
ncbi:hypothetical protein CF326_g3735 [Tilletia indica]|nr:hypothetical protein CF326_g3735 [Tilletia indica]